MQSHRSNAHNRTKLLQFLLTSLLLLFGMLLWHIDTKAQLQSTRIELFAHNAETAMLHVRIPRGQTIDAAQITQGESTLTLEIAEDPLPETHWIVLDAGQDMVNLQSAAQSAVQRFLRNADASIGLITFDSGVQTLLPTTRSAEIDDFLLAYAATANEPACIWQALDPITESERDLDRSWRILIITAGNFADQSGCEDTDTQSLPAPVDVIVLADELDPILQDIIDRSGGDFFRANLRTIDARVTEVRARWGEPTYSLSGEWLAAWDEGAPFELVITLNDGDSDTHTLMLQEYEIAAQPTPVPTATATEIAASDTPNPTETETEVAVVNVPEATETTVPEASPTPIPDEVAPEDQRNLTFPLILVVALFMVTAAVVAFSFIRMNKIPAAPVPDQPDNFYDTLDPTDAKAAIEDDPITERLDPISDDTNDFGEETRNPDDLLITQVLTDDRFRMMIEQSLEESEVIAWLRLEGPTAGDFELTRRGVMIGRSQECDIQVTGDSAVSRQHVRIDVHEDDTVTISRLSAINPVVINGKQVGNRHPLEPNNVIHLSDRTRLVFILKQDDMK